MAFIQEFVEKLASLPSLCTIAYQRTIYWISFRPPKPTYDLIVQEIRDDNNRIELSMKLNSLALNVLGEKKVKKYGKILKEKQISRQIRPFIATTSRGNRIVCLDFRPNSTDNCSIIVYSHTNGCDLGAVVSAMQKLCRKCRLRVVAYDYSGYGRSSGKPSERNIYADIECVVKRLVCIERYDPKSIILYGESIGSVPTVDLASRLSVGGMILHAPLMSGIRAMFYNYDQRLSMTFDPFANIDKISSVDCPVLVIHGLKDTTIDVKHGLALYKRSRHRVEPLFLKSGNHSNGRTFKHLYERIDKFLVEMTEFHVSKHLNANSEIIFNSNDTGTGVSSDEQISKTNDSDIALKEMPNNLRNNGLDGNPGNNKVIDSQPQSLQNDVNKQMMRLSIKEPQSVQQFGNNEKVDES